MTGIVSRFPASWLTEIVVMRGGGRDDRGNPLPIEEITLEQCLVGPRSTTERAGRDDLTSSAMSIYRDPDPNFRFLPTDQIRVPDGALNSGDWSVDGRPKEYPLGVEVPIKEGP